MATDKDSIAEARKSIKDDITNTILRNKGQENYISLNSKDVEYIFELYDEIFFHNQIREEIQKQGMPIKTAASTRRSGTAGVCGRKVVDGIYTYYLDVAPNVVMGLMKRGLPVLASGVGCYDRLECTMLVIEQQIIHLLCLLLSEAYDPESSDPIYGAHGKLFQCMIKKYFGHTRYSRDLGLTAVEIEEPVLLKSGSKIFSRSKEATIGAGFENWAASCYIDSVMMVLFDCISPFWRKGVMDSNIDEIDYQGKICSASPIDTDEKMRDFAKRVQKQMREDYVSMHSKNEVVKCTLLRHLLSECLPAMRPRGQWVIFNTGALYDAIVDIFPHLKLDIPYQINRWISDDSLVPTPDGGGGRYQPDVIEYASEATVTMWDYMDPLTDHEEGQDFKRIRWDLVDSPVLVFYNGGTPRVRNFRKSGNEKGMLLLRGDNTHSVQKYEFNIYKERNFDYTIINGRYRLIGVVTLEGVSPTNEGGAHYTSHFMGRDGGWYYYNDLGAIVRKVDDLPEEGVWVERNGSMPSMYFYQRLKSPDPRASVQPVPIPGPRPNLTGTPKVAYISGVVLDYKKIQSPADPDDDVYFMYFVYDKTPNLSLIPHLEKLMPLTNVANDIRMWKVNRKDTLAFENELKAIDVMGSKLKSVEDITAPGALYLDYSPEVKIYYYTPSTYAVTISSKVSETLDRSLRQIGLYFDKLRYGIEKRGYVFSRTKLDEVKTIIG